MAGAGVGRMRFQPADRFARRLGQRVLDLLRFRVQRGGFLFVAAVAGLPGAGPVGGVQHRHALDRADGQVEVGHGVRVLAALGGADLGDLGRAGVRVRGPVGGYRRLLAFGGVFPLPFRGEDLAVRPDPLHEQPVEHPGVDLPGQAERLARRGAGPLAGRFPGGGVVGHGARAPAGVLPAGEVGDVVPGVERHVRGHAGHLPRACPRSFGLMPVSDVLAA